MSPINAPSLTPALSRPREREQIQRLRSKPFKCHHGAGLARPSVASLGGWRVSDSGGTLSLAWPGRQWCPLGDGALATQGVLITFPQ